MNITFYNSRVPNPLLLGSNFTDTITFLGTMVREDIWHCMREFSKNQTRKTYLRCEEKNIQEYPRASERILKTLVGVESLGLNNVMS